MSNFFQKLLWNIAGAEIPLLEKCQTDHKKFSAIGATILMTSFIAFCAGTSAAWYFTQKGNDDSGTIGWSLAFGLIWALLIFCIDRSLVITLKKDPTKTRQSYVIPLLSRSLLAIIIAFMVSIPLELLIFEDYITANEENFKANQVAVLGEQLKDNSGENILSSRINNADSTLMQIGRVSDKLDKEIRDIQTRINKLEQEKKTPMTPAYRDAKNRYDKAIKDYNIARANYTNENSKEYPSQSLLSSYTSQMNVASSVQRTARQDMNKAAQECRNMKQNEIDKLIPQRDAKTTEKNNKDIAYNNTLESQLKDKNRIQEITDERLKKEIIKQEHLSNGNHFIHNFQILEYSVWQRDKNGNLTDETQLMFLWLIRLLFFIVEILPTIVKIVSPVGSYERLVYAEEQQLMEYINSDEYNDRIRNIHNLAISIQEELQQQQHDLEIDLKRQLIEKMKNAQIEVAEYAITKWRENEMKKIDSNMSSAKKSKDEENELDNGGILV